MSDPDYDCGECGECSGGTCVPTDVGACSECHCSDCKVEHKPAGTPVEGKECRVCDGSGGEKNAPDGAECTTSSDKPGFCKQGVCVEKTCENIYGEGYVKCPSGATDNFKCCSSDEVCCHAEKGADPVCCNKKSINDGLTECAGNSMIKKLNYCKDKKCKEGEVMCKALLGKVCCKKTDDYICGSQGGVPFCGKKENCPEGTHECVRDGNWGDDSVLCCDNEKEYCGKIPDSMGKKTCIPKVCNTGEVLCQGSGSYSWSKVCCPKGSACYKHPNGYPKCVDVPPPPEDKEQDTESNTVSTETSKTSVYMLRESSTFTRSGEAYHLEGSSGFNKNITLRFGYNDSDYENENNINIYRFDDDDIIGACDHIGKEYKLSSFGPDGAVIEIGSLTIIIPPGAVNSTQTLNVSLVEFFCDVSQCWDESMVATELTLGDMIWSIERWSSGFMDMEELLFAFDIWKNGF
ncbi:MAG: hypothetical protein DRO99_01915 [Candidatus Aenigmatarchaeota archaeon]|nr:MAG: hypothetical protein DRO99_01915 [Candidatus Aenigmarchaeota archaeon]